MTITSTPSEITYAGDGVSTVFTIPFVFDTSADLKVVETVAGLPTVVTTGFSIAGGAGLTGTLTRSVALPVGTNILILDNPALTQPVDYVDNDRFPAATHEGALDRVTRLVKRLNERVDRSLRVADGDLIDGDNNLLPIASVRAGKFGTYDAQGRPSVASGTGNDSALRTDLAATVSGADGSRLSGFRRTEAGSVARSVYFKLLEWTSITDFGAVSGTGDCSAALVAAMAASYVVDIPPGDWRFDTRVQIEADCQVRLSPFAVCTRYSAFSAATTPMFWLHGSRASLVGGGQSSRIKTQNKSPDGVVLVGHASLSVSHANVLNCEVRNVRLGGNTNYGQTVGAQDCCLKVINPQLGGLASYYHLFDNLFLDAANYGIWLQGWANANRITKIHIQAVGNNTIKSAAVYVQGALENVGGDITFNDAPNSTCFRFEDLDNTGNGGVIHVPAYNSFWRNECEQTGGAALGVVANSAVATFTGFGNVLELRDNSAGGNSLSAFALANNDFYLSSSGPSFAKATVIGTTTLNKVAIGKALSVNRVALAFAANVTIDASLGSSYETVATGAINYNAPTNGTDAQVLWIRLRNTSGGGLTPTFNAIFKIVVGGAIANNFERVWPVFYDSTNWRQYGASVDIPV